MIESRLFTSIFLMLTFLLMASTVIDAAPQSIALNRSCTYTPEAKYAFTKDDGDAVQLTDGLYATGDCLWTDRKTVGWNWAG